MGMMKNGWYEYKDWKTKYLNRELDGVLYKLCQENWEHTNTEIIRAKFVIVNRVYAAGAERHVKYALQEELGCIEPYVIKLHELRGELDRRLKRLRSNYSLDAYAGTTVSDPKIVADIVDFHGWLNTNLQFVTRNEVSLRSFVSKYLHFHVPIFPIYDSNSTLVIDKSDWYPWKNEWDEKYNLCPKDSDEEYWIFCIRIAEMVAEWPYGRHLPPTSRNIDRLLMCAATNGWYSLK